MKLIRNLYKRIPFALRLNFRRILKYFLYKLRFYNLRFAVLRNKDIKIIIGAALTNQKGWYSTNEEWLDVSNSKDWHILFKDKNIVSKVVAEHVFEHLSEKKMRYAINLIYKYLKKDGTLRIAVPDGNHPDPIYRSYTGIKGLGADASDHKQFIKYEFIRDILIECGFKANIKEGYLMNGKLVRSDISSELGFIKRTRSNKNLNKNYGWNFIDSNTSLIIDAIKL